MERDGDAFQNAVIVTDESAEFFRKIAKIQRERDHFQACLERISAEETRGSLASVVRAARVALLQAQEGQV
jgi:hypothetical protein